MPKKSPFTMIWSGRVLRMRRYPGNWMCLLLFCLCGLAGVQTVEAKGLAGAQTAEARGLNSAQTEEAKGAVDLFSEVDKSRITIGDLILYTVTVTHDEWVKPELPGLAANLGGFEIRDYNVHEPEKLKGLVVSTVDYTISTFLTGEFEIPPLTIAYTTTADTTRYFLSTEPIKITVESMKPSE